MTYRGIKRHIKQLNRQGRRVLFFLDIKKSAIYFDVGEDTGNGWKEFTSDMLTKTGCETARFWIKVGEIKGVTKQDFCAMFYSLDEKYHMEAIQ